MKLALPLLLFLIFRVAHAAEHSTVRAAIEKDSCQMKLAETYGLRIPFDGQELLRAMKKKELKSEAQLTKVIFGSVDQKDRVELEWVPRARHFKVSKIAGARKFADFVDSPDEIKTHYDDLKVIFRQLQFDVVAGQGAEAKKKSDKTGLGAAMAHALVTDNGEKITRLVTQKFSCEFLDFFSCSCLP